MVILADGGVPSLVLLVADHLLSQDLVLVAHSVELDHESLRQEESVHFGVSWHLLQLLHKNLQHLPDVCFVFVGVVGGLTLAS